MKVKLIYTIYALLIVLLAFSLLWACKKQDSDPDTSNSKVEQHDKQNLQAISFRPKWHPQAQFAGIYMAQKMGFYNDYGLDIDFQPALSDSEAVREMQAGNTDILSLDLLTALSLNNRKNTVVNIGQTTQKASLMLVGRKSRGIRSIKDFSGKKLGLWRSGPNIIPMAYLKDHDIDMDVVYIDWSINLFTQGVLDVVNVMRYNEYHQILQSGIPEDDLFILAFDETEYNIPDEGFYTSEAFYRAHPKACRAFVEATMDGWTYAFTHPEETIEEVLRIMKEAQIRANVTHQSWMLQNIKDVVMEKPDNLGVLTEMDFNNAQDVLHKMGILDRNIGYQEFYPSAPRQ